jgi:hypothetical protein
LDKSSPAPIQPDVAINILGKYVSLFIMEQYFNDVSVNFCEEKNFHSDSRSPLIRRVSPLILLSASFNQLSRLSPMVVTDLATLQYKIDFLSMLSLRVQVNDSFIAFILKLLSEILMSML